MGYNFYNFDSKLAEIYSLPHTALSDLRIKPCFQRFNIIIPLLSGIVWGLTIFVTSCYEAIPFYNLDCFRFLVSTTRQLVWNKADSSLSLTCSSLSSLIALTVCPLRPSFHQSQNLEAAVKNIPSLVPMLRPFRSS